MKRFDNGKINILKNNGFTLIELIVVLAGLGMLSSLVLPNFIDLLDSNNVDEAKTLLNTAAADCLRQKRLQSSSNPKIDPSIISDAKILSIGYKIDPTSSKIDSDYYCDDFMLEPITGDNTDSVRFNMGFELDDDGKLTKKANTGDIDGKGSNCDQWASNGCTSSTAAKELKEYKDQIKAEKKKCDTAYSSWASNGMNPVKFKIYDTTKGPASCPSTPPGPGGPAYRGTENCNTTGCTEGIPVWGLWNKETKTGTTYSSEDAYEVARKNLLGAKCDEAITAKKTSKYTNISKNGEELFDKTGEITCDGNLYWFYEGADAGSQKTWEILYYKANNPTGKQTLSDGSELYLCLGEEKATEALMTKCINDNEEAGCENQINEQIAANYKGEFIARPGGPGACSSVNWMCDGKNYQTDKTAYDDSCAKKNCGLEPTKCHLKRNKEVCAEYEACMSG